VTTPSLPLARSDCWHRIGVWGDRSCPELAAAVHCQHCPVFAAAGRDFLASPPPEGYLQEWAARLADSREEELADVQSVLIFRLGGEWLALPVECLREVISLRPVHRIPFRGGLLAGLVNVRGELHLSIRLERVLGIEEGASGGRQPPVTCGEPGADVPRSPRLLVVGREPETWVFRVDEVDRVHRLTVGELEPAPPTLDRATARFTRGIFRCRQRAVGLLDEERFFEGMRASVR
jgi:chemotaxis-related protein WspD